MSELIVYAIPGSPFGRAVLWALEEKALPHRLAVLQAGEHRGEAHLARNPFGRVPVIEHDGFLLYETQAILRYLDRLRAAPALTPADARQAARMDQLMGIADWYLFQGVANVIGFQRVIVPLFLKGTPDEAAIAAAMPKAQAVYSELTRLLGDQPYMAGSALSLADILVASQVDFMDATPEGATLMSNRPTLRAWLQRMQDRPGFKATTTPQLMARVARG